MKKIAIITTHPIQYQIPLFKNLKKKNIIPHVFFASKHGLNSKDKDREFGIKFNWDLDQNILEGYKYFFSKNQKYSIESFRLSFNNLEKFFKKNRYDALLFFGWNKIIYLKSFFIAKKLGIKTILRVETNLNSKIFFIKKLLKFFLLTIFFKFIDYFIYIGKLNKEFYIKHRVPPKKLFYAPYFVDNSFFDKENFDKNKLKKKYNLNYKKIVLFVGKFIERKKPINFLNIAKKFKKKKNIHFLMIGSGVLIDKCKFYLKKNNLNNVSIIGFQNQKQLREYYLISDVLILPSEYETWGLVINEAMASGMPVISTNQCGGTVDLVKNNNTGFSYDKNDSKTLFNRLNILLKNDQKVKKIKKNIKLHISKFTYETTINSLNKIIYGQ